MDGITPNALSMAHMHAAPPGARMRQMQSRARAALRMAAMAWFATAVLGQGMFAVYVVGFYGRAAAHGHPERWNDVLAVGYVSGDTVGNLVLASHLLLALAVTAGGLLQLVPAIRSRWPRFHRWNGRVFVVSAVAGALGGLYMIWTRDVVGDAWQDTGMTVLALLIVGCAALAWRDARARRLESHRRWALRLFLVANGGWFFRIGMMFWLVVNQAPVGFDPKTFTGPFLNVLVFAQFVLPLCALEAYLRAQKSSSGWTQGVVASTLGVLALVTATGVAAATAMLWWPHLH
jgi:uncharacterized membrane protein